MSGARRASLAFSVLLMGCVTGDRSSHAFTSEWADSKRLDADFQERVERAEGGEVVLLGKEGKNRAAVRVDEKGKTKLFFGKMSGLQADLDIRHGEPDVKVRYRVKW